MVPASHPATLPHRRPALDSAGHPFFDLFELFLGVFFEPLLVLEFLPLAFFCRDFADCRLFAFCKASISSAFDIDDRPEIFSCWARS